MSFVSSLASLAWASAALAGAYTAGGASPPALGSSGDTTHPAKSVSSTVDAQPELLLMDVMYDQLRVDSSLGVLEDKQGRRYVPLRQFAATLGFRLHVDPAKKRVSGFLNSPSDKLDVDAAKGTYRLRRTTGKFDPNLAFARDGDLYLDSELFSKMAGLKLQWQMNLLQLNVASTSPLNVEKQWIQRARADIDLMAANAQTKYPAIPIPYKLWSVPSIDAQIYSSSASSSAFGTNATSISITGAGDLLMMSAQYRVISDSNGSPTALLSLGRSDPEGKLLGEMHASQFSFGDLYLPPEPLLARGRNALGFTLSNGPLPGQQMKDFGQLRGRTVGDAQVEVYSNNQLLGSTTSDANGNYHLYSLNLNRGPNDLQIVSVTPEGDVQQVNRKVYSGIDGPSLGETRYQFTAGRIGSSVFGSDVFGTVQNQDTSEVIADFQKGLGNGTWASAVSALTTGQQGTGEEFGLGLHSWIGPLLWNAQSMVAPDGGAAISTGFSRQIGNINATLERTQASGSLASRILPEIGANGTSLTSLDFEGTNGGHGLSTSYGLDFDRLEGSAPATVIRARLARGNQDLMISNSLTYRMSEAPTEMSGYTEIRKALHGATGLLDLGYGIGDGPNFQLARLTLSRGLNSVYSGRVGLEYDATRTQPLGALATIYHAFGPVDIGLNVELLQRGSVTAGILFSTGLQGEGSRGHMALASPGASDSGSVMVRAFVDKHQTGRYEPDDPLLPAVSFLIDGHPRSVSTGKDGKAVIDHLSPNQRISVSADEESFEDPSWVSENPGITTVPRPGRAVSIDFPVLETAEIEGKYTQAKDASPHPGMSAQLVDSKNNVSDTSVLDSSGTYVFSRVRPGVYVVRLIDLDGKTVDQRSVKVLPGAIMKAVDIDGAHSLTNRSQPSAPPASSQSESSPR